MANEAENRKRLPVSVSSAVFIEDERGGLLLLEQVSEKKGQRWGPPAGGMELHEDPITTALRETKEEIGVTVELTDLLGIYTVDRGTTTSGLGFVFRGKITSGDIAPQQDEIASFKYFSPDEIKILIRDDMLYKPEYNIDGIKDWLKGKSYPLEAIKRLG